METGLNRIALVGFTNLARTSLAKIGGSFSVWPDKTTAKYMKVGFVWLLAIVIGAVSVWMVLSSSASITADNHPMRLATAVGTDSASPSATDSVADNFPGSPANPVSSTNKSEEVIARAETAPVDGLKISSQSWRRGGLGSKALITLTLRNGNNYAVKDIELVCAFARSDGSHLTDRKRIIHDTINMRSRKTFARMHIGFVNINADRAKCSLVAASQA
jgi:hypothetical protein